MADPLGPQRGAVVLAARRLRADVPLRPEERTTQEQDHRRPRYGDTRRSRRSFRADHVVRGGGQGKRSGSVLHAPL